MREGPLRAARVLVGALSVARAVGPAARVPAQAARANDNKSVFAGCMRGKLGARAEQGQIVRARRSEAAAPFVGQKALHDAHNLAGPLFMRGMSGVQQLEARAADLA